MLLALGLHAAPAWASQVSREAVTAKVTQVDAIAGAPLIVPLRDDATARGAPALRASAPGIGALACSVRVVEARAYAGPTPDAEQVQGRMMRWLDDPGVWTSRVPALDVDLRRGPARAMRDGAQGFAFVTLPAFATPDAKPATLTLAEDVVGVRWIASAAELMEQDKRLRPGHPDAPWRATLPEDAPLGETLRAVLLREATNPWKRWRVRLVLDGLTPEGTATSRELAPDFDDAGVEALAAWQDARARALIARLAQIDLDLCRRICLRLGRIAEVGPETWAPAWNPDGGAFEDLFARVLLDAGEDDANARTLALGWLERQPQGAAWVVDDAGVLTSTWSDAEGDGVRTTRASTTLALTHLGDQRTLAWVQPDGVRADEQSASDTDLHPIAAGRTIMLTPVTLGEARDGARAGDGMLVRVHAGAWSSPALRVLDALVPVRPPGLVTGQWLADPTLGEWLHATTERGSPMMPPACAAMISRSTPDAAGVAHWEVFIECAAGPRASDEGQAVASVTVYAGPPHAPLAVVSVAPDGSATDVLHAGNAEDRARVAVYADRWTARVRLGPDVVDKDGVLRLALTCVTTQGVRWSWPRAMPPWQEQPSRMPLHVAAWDE